MSALVWQRMKPAEDRMEFVGYLVLRDGEWVVGDTAEDQDPERFREMALSLSPRPGHPDEGVTPESDPDRWAKAVTPYRNGYVSVTYYDDRQLPDEIAQGQDVPADRAADILVRTISNDPGDWFDVQRSLNRLYRTPLGRRVPEDVADALRQRGYIVPSEQVDADAD